MEAFIKFLKSLGLSEQEIKTLVKKVPVNQEGLMGTNVATGIFSKPKEGKLAKDFLVSDTIGNPFEIDYFKGRPKKEILISAEAQLKMIDDELTKLTDQLLNKNLQLSEAQQINFAKNLETRKRFKKDFETFKTKPEAEVLNIETGKKVEDIEALKESSGLVAPPTSPIGKIDLMNKQMLQRVDNLFPSEATLQKEEAKRQALIAKQYEGKGYAGGTFGPSGMYRSVARDFLLDQNAKGRIKLTDDVIKNLEERNYISGGQPLMYPDPIRVMRFHYGDDVFEKIPLDKIKTGAKSEILDAMSKVEVNPVKTVSPATPGGYMTPGEIKANIDELKGIENMIKRRESRFADMTEEQIQNELEQYGSKRSSFEMALQYDHPEEAKGLDYLTGQEPPKNGYAGGGRIGYAEGSPMAGLVYVGSWEGPWTGPEFLGGPRKGQYYNNSKGLNILSSVPTANIMPGTGGFPGGPLSSPTTTSDSVPLSLKDQYLNRLSAIQSSGSSYEDFKNLLESKLQKKAKGGSIGLNYLMGL